MITVIAYGQLYPVEAFQFSGGEIQVRLSDALCQAVAMDGNRFAIRADLRSPSDIMTLLLATDALRRVTGTDSRIILVCPYLPYARQDRVCADGEALSLRVMADLINGQHYASVEVWDAHSDVAAALLDNCRNIKPWALLTRVRPKNAVLVAPDAGALKKVSEVAQKHGLSMVRADKTRDPNTGAITGTVVYSDHIGNHDFLIVDDICDGGRTFVELAQKLRPLTNGQIHLYVTHGIFSAGFDTLKQHIDRIYCANPFPAELPDFVTII